jgi:hypothetical protein
MSAKITTDTNNLDDIIKSQREKNKTKNNLLKGEIYYED